MTYVHRYGSGPDSFLCVHGWGGTHRTYAPLAELVPASASLFALDLPGYGRSSPPLHWSADVVGEAVARVLPEIDSSDVTIVGNCSGAVFALIAAQLAPDRVRRIVLIDAFAFVPWYFKVFVHPVYGELAYRSTFANPVGRFFTNASLRNRRSADTHLTDSFRGIPTEVSLEYLRMLDAIGTVDRFAGIHAPVDLLYGAKTFAAVRESVRQWQALWPQARPWELEGAGHLPIAEAAPAVADILFAPAAAARRR
jgi:pimeloyl-ACP methyl ester carboxylesterase